MQTTHRPSALFRVAYPLSAVMLVVWAIVTFGYNGPGWIHGLLTLGVFLLIWRIVAGGTEEAWRRRSSNH